ncbi:uncharacterized protein VTP21DRAFT_10872 [Calcarisporiella thermophila]|uniref:uncharacterized protein n=1 Tax=Calcarisporiella thermophila TaxID=911321 RepID=UPI0037445D15
MASNSKKFSSIEDELAYYKQQAKQLAEALNETQAGLDEFQQSSRELEDELERELELRERRCRELEGRVEILAGEVEEWKDKYRDSQKVANQTAEQMQREIETLRSLHETFKVRTRELELDNDDLERTERAAQSSLQDLESKFNKMVERNAMLENELEIKTQLQEQNQRLKDELRDVNTEMAVLKQKLQHQEERRKMASIMEIPMTPRTSRLGENNHNHYKTPMRGFRTPAAMPMSPLTPANNPVRMVQEMVGRVKTLEARLQSCRSTLVAPLLTTGPTTATDVKTAPVATISPPSSIPIAPNSTLMNRPGSPRRPTSPVPLSPKYRRKSLGFRSVSAADYLRNH